MVWINRQRPIYGQRTKLQIGNGICIQEADFGIYPGLQIYYGYTLNGAPAPLGLNLGGYSAFQLNFAALSNFEPLGVEIAVWLHNGNVYAQQALLPPSTAFSADFPFSKFTGGGLTQSDVSQIDYIGVVTWGGTATFGITSFKVY